MEIRLYSIFSFLCLQKLTHIKVQMYSWKEWVLHIHVFAWMWIKSLVAFLFCFSFDFESVESTVESSVDKSKPWSRSIEDLHRGSNLPSPVGNSVSRSGRHPALRWVPWFRKEADMSGQLLLRILGHVLLYLATQHLCCQWLQMQVSSGVHGIITGAILSHFQ